MKKKICMTKLYVAQETENSCGIACLSSIAKFYNIDFRSNDLINLRGGNFQGNTLLELKKIAGSIGLEANGYMCTIEELEKCSHPAILHTINSNGFTHFIVSYGYMNNHFLLMDPALGVLYYTKEELNNIWATKSILLFESSKKKGNQNIKPSCKENYIRKYLLPLINADYRLLFITFILSAFTSLFGVASAVFLQTLVDTILPQKNFQTLLSYLLCYCCIILISQIASYVNTNFIITQNLFFNIRIIKKLLHKIFQLPISFFMVIKTGDIISRLNYAEKIQNSIIYLVNTIIIELLMMFFSIFVLLWYDWSIALATLLSIPLLALITYFYSVKISKQNETLMREYATFDTYSIDTLSGIREIRSFQKEDVFFRRLLSFYKNTQRTSRLLKHTNTNYELSIGMVSAFFSFFTILLGSYYVMIGRIHLGALFAIITIVTMIIQSSIKIVSYAVDIQEAKIAFKRIIFLLDCKTEKELLTGAINNDFKMKEVVINRLEIKNLSFNYFNQPLLLKNINFIVETGQIVSIFGTIGTGKTTIINLIQRFYTGYSGKILYNAHNIEEFSISGWRSIIGYVPQQTKTFVGTIKDNITLFEKNPDTKRVFELCNQLMAKKELTDSITLDLQIDENGSNLSGGQKQIIGIARALYKRPKILLLDEPTSSLDKESELAIINILKEIKNELIIIMITHKPEIAKLSDKIYVIENKTFSCNGNHDDLIYRSNMYSKAYNMLIS
ncbi:peptidase domain-containing ABC transporter [Hoylesella timonensis]|uniref:peptidase domain-containing ABC transporter n=1 Tax=Hoylesella timonensis TaxID=386414 RepID=UPI003369C4E6